MQQKIKRYNVTIRNHVQLIGYRGAVKVIAEGEDSLLDVFFADLRRIREGVDVETREVSRDTDLPVTFSRVATDENLEQMKRFDKGIELLGRIDNSTSLLVDLQNKLVDGQNKLVDYQNKLMDGQNKLVDGQSKVVTLLEKIESKIK